MRHRRVNGFFVMMAVVTAWCVSCSRSPQGAVALESGRFATVEVIGSRGTAPGQFNKPRSVTVDSQDNLYVVDMTGRVQKFSPEGRYLLMWQMPQTDLGKPKGLCGDRRGNVYVVEPHYARVNLFSGEGRLLGQWGTRGTHAGELGQPRALGVNSRGEVWTAEYSTSERLQKFSPDGAKALTVVGTPGVGEGQFNRPEGLAVDGQDHVFVADSCNHRVQVFEDSGRLVRVFGQAGTAPGQLSYPYDVAVDRAGVMYVCEFGNSRVQVFDASGRSLEILGGAGAEPGRFSNPWSVTLDSKGNLYVADAMNHRVQKFIPRTPGNAGVAR